MINPNIATVQTSREDASSVDVERHKSEPIADHVYLLPVTADNVRHILDKEKNIDGACLFNVRRLTRTHRYYRLHGRANCIKRGHRAVEE